MNEGESLLCAQLPGTYNHLVCSDSRPIVHSKAQPQYTRLDLPAIVLSDKGLVAYPFGWNNSLEPDF